MEGYPDPPELRGIIPKSFEVLVMLLNPPEWCDVMSYTSCTVSSTYREVA